jgi:hypothetical protein
MRRSNPKLFVKQVIGSLKKQHGCSVEVYKMTSSDIDRKTGTRTSSSTSIEVDNCIVLPAKVTSQVNQSISYISASKPFIMGGQYVAGKRNFIFDFEERRGIPFDYEWTLSDWIIVDDASTGRLERYDVESFEELFFGSGWMVTANRITGVTPQRSVKESLTDTLQLRVNHSVGFTIE